MKDLAAVLAALRSFRYDSPTEVDLQEGVCLALDRIGVVYERERRLDQWNRIDFYLPRLRAGIEIKLQAPPVSVMRQLHRYAQHPDIDALALMTTSARLGTLPRELNGKPVTILVLWEGCL